MRGACPHADAAACTCGELHLQAALAPATQWAGLAAIQLQRWAALRAARAAADPDPDSDQGGDGGAAEWAGCTALAQVGPLLRVLARAGNAAGSPAARDPRRQVRLHPGCLPGRNPALALMRVYGSGRPAAAGAFFAQFALVALVVASSGI